MELTVYSSNGCAGCVAVVQHFERTGVRHKVVKIDESVDGMAFFRAAGHRTVPQVYTPDGALLGSSLMDMLKLPVEVVSIFK